MLNYKFFRKEFVISFFGICIIIFFSVDTIIFRSSEATGGFLSALVPLFILFAIVTTYLYKRKFNVVAIKVILIWFVSIVGTLVTAEGYGFGYFYLIFLLITVAFLSQIIGLTFFSYLYNNVLFFLSVIAIAIYLMLISGYDIFPNATIYENDAGIRFKYLYLVTYMIDNYPRATSIFREPGVYAIYLIVAILFELFILRTSKFKLAIFSLSMLFSHSSAGIIAMLFIYVLYIFRLKKTFKDLTVYFLAFLLILIALYFNPELTDTFFNKFDSDSDTYGSALARYASVVANIDIFLSNPVFGVGLLQYPEDFKIATYQAIGIELESGGGSTNTFLAQFAIFGVFGGTLFIYLLYDFSKRVGSNLISTLVIFASLAMVLSSQDMRFSPFINLLLFLSIPKVSSRP